MPCQPPREPRLQAGWIVICLRFVCHAWCYCKSCIAFRDVQAVLDEAMEQLLFVDGTSWEVAPPPISLRPAMLELVHALVAIQVGVWAMMRSERGRGVEYGCWHGHFSDASGLTGSCLGFLLSDIKQPAVIGCCGQELLLWLAGQPAGKPRTKLSTYGTCHATIGFTFCHAAAGGAICCGSISAA